MRLNLKAVLGIVLSLALLGGMFLLVPFADVAEQLRQADLGWFALAVVVATLAIPVRALRWKVLLHPVAPGLPFHPRNAATAIGFAANNILPGRAGEFARAFVLGRLTGVPITAAFGTLVVERIFDGIVIVGLLFLVMAMPQFPVGQIGGVDPRGAAALVALAMAGVAGVLFALVVAPGRTVALLERVFRRVLPQRFQRGALDVLHAFLRGVSVLRSPRLFLVSLVWALAQWGFLALSFFFAMRAFGIDEPGFLGAVFIQSIVGLAVAVPTPVAGGLHFAPAIPGLSLWGVPTEKALSFAIALHVGGFIPVTLMGAWYVWRLNLSWGQIESSKEVVEETVDVEAAAPAEPRG